jgi:hypothetical protein
MGRGASGWYGGEGSGVGDRSRRARAHSLLEQRSGLVRRARLLRLRPAASGVRLVWGEGTRRVRIVRGDGTRRVRFVRGRGGEGKRGEL